MNVNMPFGIDQNTDWYSIEKEARDGVWPLSYNGVWHTGIHFKANEKISLLRPFIPGKIVASRICEKYEESPFGHKYSTSFVLMKHYFGSKKIPFYILYSGLASKEAIEGYTETGTDENKVKKYNEFIPYKNQDENDIYRPIFCRKWLLKSDAIDVMKEEESHVPAFYKNNNISGYFNRDGSYIFKKTPIDCKFRVTDKDKYDIKLGKDNPEGFSKINEIKYFSTINEVKINNFDHDPETNEDNKKTDGIWLTVYYDNKFSSDLKKFKVNIAGLGSQLFVKSENQYEFNKKIEKEKLYRTKPFYILTNFEAKKMILMILLISVF